MSARHERTPLLADASQPRSSLTSTQNGHDRSGSPADGLKRSSTPSNDIHDVSTKRTPLPWLQLLVICFARFTEPIAFTVILPFVNQQVADLHIVDDPRQVGYYAGLIESAFALAQFCTVLQIGTVSRLRFRLGQLNISTGKLSDRIGRKPVIIVGLLGASLSTLLFGLSRSWPALIITRSLAGALNGNAGVIKVVIAEVTDESNKGQAFALLPLTWAVGASLGSLIGGFASQPTRFALFRDVQLLHDYPYLLPCAIAALCPLIGALATGCCLTETLQPRRMVPSTPSVEGGEPAMKPEMVDNSLRNLLTPQVRAVLLNYGLLALYTICLAALIPLYFFTPLKHGGLSLSTSDIGLALSVQGLAGCLLQLFAYPPLQRRFGTLPLYRATVLIYPLVFALMPTLNPIAAKSSQQVLFAAIAGILCLAAAANLCYSSTMLLVADAAPRRQSLGAVNGLAQSVASLMRAIGPAAATSLFAFSVQHDVLHGRLAWLLLFLLAAANFGATYSLRDDGAIWRKEEAGA